MKSSRTKKRTTPSGAVSNSVTAVVFQTDNTLISSGAADGYVNSFSFFVNNICSVTRLNEDRLLT